MLQYRHLLDQYFRKDIRLVTKSRKETKWIQRPDKHSKSQFCFSFTFFQILSNFISAPRWQHFVFVAPHARFGLSPVVKFKLRVRTLTSLSAATAHPAVFPTKQTLTWYNAPLLSWPMAGPVTSLPGQDNELLNRERKSYLGCGGAGLSQLDIGCILAVSITHLCGAALVSAASIPSFIPLWAHWLTSVSPWADTSGGSKGESWPVWTLFLRTEAVSEDVHQHFHALFSLYRLSRTFTDEVTWKQKHVTRTFQVI